MSLAERTKAAIASGDEDAIPRAPKRYEQILEGRDFCETLPELSAEGVRAHLLENDLPVVTEVGMTSLALCQFYYRDKDAALLTLHRLMVYLDFKEEKEGVTEQLRYFRHTAGQLLSEDSGHSLDFYAGSKSIFKHKDEADWASSDFFDSSASKDVDDFWVEGISTGIWADQ